jgi:hypothetical protein
LIFRSYSSALSWSNSTLSGRVVRRFAIELRRPAFSFACANIAPNVVLLLLSDVGDRVVFDDDDDEDDEDEDEDEVVDVADDEDANTLPVGDLGGACEAALLVLLVAVDDDGG